MTAVLEYIYYLMGGKTSVDLTATIGNVYEKTPGTNLADFSVQGTTPTTDGDEILFPADASATTLNNYIRFNSIGDRILNAYKEYTISCVVSRDTVSADGAKFVFGKEGIHSNLSRGNAVSNIAEIDFSTGNVGKVNHFFGQTYIGQSVTYNQSENTAVSYTNADEWVVECVMNRDTQTISIYEHSGGGVKGTQLKTNSFHDETFQPADTIAWSSSPGYFIIGATGPVRVHRVSLTINQKKHLHAAWLGDSIPHATRLNNSTDAFPFYNRTGENVGMYGGTGCRADDLVLLMPCLKLDLSESSLATWAGISCGINDQSSGRASSAYADDVETMVNDINSVSGIGGVIVISQTAWNQDSTANEAAVSGKGFTNYLDVFTLTKGGTPDYRLNPLYVADSTHPNQLCHDDVIGATLVSTFPQAYS